MASNPPRLPAQANALPAPLYAQLKQMIAQQIRSGAWPAHYRVPSESELVQELGYSRMTINRALRELTAEGLLVRMQGVGTFVAQPKTRSALFAVNNIADEIV
ncbi:GntR family transcriptional regulator, partial [Achromobacter dolens]